MGRSSALRHELSRRAATMRAYDAAGATATWKSSSRDTAERLQLTLQPPDDGRRTTDDGRRVLNSSVGTKGLAGVHAQATARRADRGQQADDEHDPCDAEQKCTSSRQIEAEH